MKDFSEETVNDLVQYGYAYMPIEAALLESAESAARIFLLAQTSHWRDWHFSRKDNTEVGIVEEISAHAEPAQSKNFSLAFAHDLSRKRSVQDPHTRACLSAITNLYRDMRRQVSCLSLELCRRGIADISLRVRDTFEMGEDRATTLHLRSSVCGKRSLTTALQADSLLSIFFGNHKSEIWLKDEVKDKWVLRSPPYGRALIFFGLKVSELDLPEFKPSLYRVDGHAGQPLRATIMHVQIKEETPTAVSSATVQPLMA